MKRGSKLQIGHQGKDIYYNGNDGEVQLATSPDSAIFFGAHTTGGWPIIHSTTLHSRVWYHVVAQVDFVTRKERLFIDGVLQREVDLASGSFVSTGSGYPPTIGSYNNGTFFYGIVGIIDEVRISNKIREVSEFHLNKY
ncbi:MAG: LamG-like jellyroll fold domain-containing protein [Bacteroidota bacterium]|nr:LamG-like jellyroll fold domain-containing protein [Bacteroidota bacterium]